MKCEKCQMEIEENVTFCTECGAKIEKKKEKKMKSSKFTSKNKFIIAGTVMIFIIALVAAFLFMPKETQVVCNSPYILVSKDCCLDKNSNAICDKDETSEKKEASEIGNSFGTKDKQPSEISNIAKIPAKIDITDSPSKGNEDAPVTLVEFSDFQCPFCSRFFSDTAPQIKEQYVKAGKVRFVYKHFPLESIHPNAMPAALASECAKEQGKFWEYHDLIFQNQQSMGDKSYKSWAKQLSLDMDKFNGCYSSQKYLSVVRSDLQQGSSAGVRGTPGFFLNGQLISGAQPFAVFQQAIDAELNTKGEEEIESEFKGKAVTFNLSEKESHSPIELSPGDDVIVTLLLNVQVGDTFTLEEQVPDGWTLSSWQVQGSQGGKEAVQYRFVSLGNRHGWSFRTDSSSVAIIFVVTVTTTAVDGDYKFDAIYFDSARQSKHTGVVTVEKKN